MDEQKMDEKYHIQIKDEKTMWMKIGKNEKWKMKRMWFTHNKHNNHSNLKLLQQGKWIGGGEDQACHCSNLGIFETF
jgi:hypothetical protein